jgi:uncharacterized protein
MQIALEPITAYNQIRSYQPGYIGVNSSVYEHSIIVAPSLEVMSWAPRTYADLLPEHFDFLLTSKPQFILLGTGYKMHLPCPEIRLALQKIGVGIEFMDTAAACRTYNVLLTENRDVVAALLIT